MNTLTDLLLGVGQPRVSHFPDLCTLLYTYLSTLDYWTKIVYYLFTQTSPVAHTSALTPTYIKSQKLPNWPISKELGLGRMLLPHWKLLLTHGTIEVLWACFHSIKIIFISTAHYICIWPFKMRKQGFLGIFVVGHQRRTATGVGGIDVLAQYYDISICWCTGKYVFHFEIGIYVYVYVCMYNLVCWRVNIKVVFLLLC